ncbi:hypothetical protein MCOR29_009418 [Pyricularia oryzae]|nr:hypothetical protein MCOR29_009418 [Pyricularia oryzae]KAI6399620.1 hypothetical protein MCOR20_008762 [Pyricularia oryzae]
MQDLLRQGVENVRVGTLIVRDLQEEPALRSKGRTHQQQARTVLEVWADQAQIFAGHSSALCTRIKRCQAIKPR